MIRRIFAFAPLIVTVTATNAQFTGDYVPETWTVTGAGIGGSSATFSPDGSMLTIFGPHTEVGHIDVTHVVANAGLWSFDWYYVSNDLGTGGFDNAYYLLNGDAVFIATSDAFCDPVSGSISIAVVAGDVIGWRVDTVDDILGGGTLIVSGFQIPGPAGLGLFAVGATVGLRRRSAPHHLD